MADILQSAPALLAIVTPNAGLETESVTNWGWPALLALIGSPGAIETAGSPDTSAVIRQSSPVLLAIVGGAGTLTLESPAEDTTAVIRQSAPVLMALVSGGAGQLEASGPVPLDISIVIGAPYTRWGVGAVYV